MTYGGTCIHCGQPGHRYGSTDHDHEPTMVACINGLLHKIELLEADHAELRTILEAVLGPGLNADEFRRRYLSGPRCGHTITGINTATTATPMLMCTHPVGHKGAHHDGVSAHWTEGPPPSPEPRKEPT